MIKFRDYLLAHPDEARRYEDLKKALGEQHDDVNAYANAKSSYVLEIVRRAKLPASTLTSVGPSACSRATYPNTGAPERPRYSLA